MWVLSSTEALRRRLVAVASCDGWRTTVPEAPQSVGAVAPPPGGAVLTEVSLDPVRPADLSGIRLAQRWRRDHGFTGSFVFVGFQSRSSLARQAALLAPGVPGVGYVRLPLVDQELIQALRETRPLTHAQFREVVRAHCGLGDLLRGQIHRLSGLLQRRDATMLPAMREVAGDLVRTLERHHLDARPAAAVLAGLEDTSGLTESLCHKLLSGLEGIDSVETPPTPRDVDQRTAPPGFDSVLIADDDGYPADALQYLEGRGYSVDVVTTREEAALSLAADPHPVFVCDQTFGEDCQAGRELLALAGGKATCRLRVALSGARLEDGEVPEADAICAGPTAKTAAGARRLHQLILERFRSA